MKKFCLLRCPGMSRWLLTLWSRSKGRRYQRVFPLIKGVTHSQTPPASVIWRLSDLWSPFPNQFVVSYLSPSSAKWSFAFFLASVGPYAVPRDNWGPGFWMSFLMSLTLTSFLSSKQVSHSSGSLGASYLSHLCKSVRMSKGIINQGPGPDISSLEAIWCLACFWRSKQTVLGSLYPQTHPRALSWLMANGELNIYGWKIRKVQEEGNLSAGVCRECTVLIGTVVTLNACLPHH